MPCFRRMEAEMVEAERLVQESQERALQEKQDTARSKEKVQGIVIGGAGVKKSLKPKATVDAAAGAQPAAAAAAAAGLLIKKRKRFGL